jgi:glycosyltransferase 2 family protein
MPNLRMSFHALSRFAKWLFIGAVFGFIALYLLNHADRVREIIHRTDPRWIMPLISVMFFVSLLRAFLWAYLIRSLGCSLGYCRLTAIWMYSLGGKYIPGSVWMVIGRAHRLQAEGSPIKINSYSIVLEQIVTLAAGLMLVLITPEITATLHIPPWLVLGMLPLSAVLLFPNLLGEIIRKIGIRKIDLRIVPQPSICVMMVYFTGTTIAFIISGLGVILMLRVSGASTEGFTLLNVSGFNAAGFVVGYITFLAPSGIGVREGVLVLLLNRYISVHYALIVAFSLRFWSLIADGAAILAGNIYISHFGNNRHLEKTDRSQ